MLEKTLELDRDLFLLINNSLESWFNDLFLGGLTLIGDVLFLLPIALVCLYVIDKKNFSKNSLILISAVLIGGLLVKIIKEVVGRPRPLKDMETLLLAGKIHIHNILQPYRENSFPSGHSQGAFGIATALICIYRKHAFFLLFIAFLIGLSRIYVGAHFPLDVICGAILGIITSVAVFYTSCKIYKIKPS